ncbi:hypothetical protein Tco_0981713, partial [Tanacetum coccineum]
MTIYDDDYFAEFFLQTPLDINKVKCKRQNATNEAKRSVLRQNATNEAKRNVLRQNATNEAKRSVLRQNATNEAKCSVLRQNATNEAKRSVLRQNAMNEEKCRVLRQNATNEAKRSVLRQNATNEAKRSDIDYIDASPLDSELVSLEEVKDFEVREIDTDILLTIKDDILREKLLNINLLIAKIEALKDNPTPSSNFVTKSPSTSPNSFLEETNIFYNSLPEIETFCFNFEEKSSGNPTSYTSLYLPDYEAFFCDSEPDLGDFTMDVVEDIFDNPTREPRVHVPNVLPTHPTLHLDSEFTLSSDSLGSDLVVSFPSRTRNKIFD